MRVLRTLRAFRLLRRMETPLYRMHNSKMKAAFSDQKTRKKNTSAMLTITLPPAEAGLTE